MIHIDSNGMISGGRQDSPAQVWYWAANAVSPVVLSSTVQGWNGGSVGGNLVYAIDQVATTGTGVFLWSGNPEFTSPVSLDARPLSRLFTAGAYWVAHDGVNAWGAVYSGTLNVAGSTAVAVQDDGSYILVNNDTRRATVYWTDGTSTNLPENLGDEWSLRDGFVFFIGHTGPYLVNRDQVFPLQWLVGTEYVAFQTIKLFGVPWIWYYHQTSVENDQTKGRALFHPHNDASRAHIINGPVYAGDIQRIGEAVTMTWAESADESVTGVRRHRLSTASELRMFNTSRIGPVYTTSSGTPSVVRW